MLPVKLGETITNFPKAWYLTSVTFVLSNIKQNLLPKAAALVKSKLVFQPIPMLHNEKNYLWSQKKKGKTTNNQPNTQQNTASKMMLF